MTLPLELAKLGGRRKANIRSGELVQQAPFFPKVDQNEISRVANILDWISLLVSGLIVQHGAKRVLY